MPITQLFLGSENVVTPLNNEYLINMVIIVSSFTLIFFHNFHLLWQQYLPTKYKFSFLWESKRETQKTRKYSKPIKREKCKYRQSHTFDINQRE